MMKCFNDILLYNIDIYNTTLKQYEKLKNEENEK